MNDDLIKIDQKNRFTSSLLSIADSYGVLIGKRIDDTQTRSEYMVYDMMDMILHLEALMDEMTKGIIHADYILEKLDRIKDYVDTTHSYFTALSDNLNSSVKED